MMYSREFIKVNVLILSVTLLISCNSTEDCVHPWKTDFGLHINDSMRESFDSLSNIIETFLTRTTLGQNETILMEVIKKCVMSSDCRIKTILDKKIEKSLTLCIVVNESESCYVSTCTCPKNNRQRRDVLSPVFESENSKQIKSPKHSECKVMPSRIFVQNMSMESRAYVNNLTKNINASMQATKTKHVVKTDVQLRDLDVSVWMNALLFCIGAGVGTLFGGFFVFIAFKRKCSPQNSASVPNKANHKEKTLKEATDFNEVTEYSEIPEYTGKADREETKIILNEHEPVHCEIQKDKTRLNYHEPLLMFDNNRMKLDWKHVEVKEQSKMSVNGCEEHPLDMLSKNLDIDATNITPKGHSVVTEELYEKPTDPYFLLSTTRNTKDSLSDLNGCINRDENQQGEQANIETLLVHVAQEDVNFRNLDELTNTEGNEQTTENEYFILKECS